MSYATPAQLAEYLGVAEGDLPSDASRLLGRASDLIDRIARGRYDASTATAYVTAQVVKATCAQVEFWITGGEGADIEGGALRYRAGSVEVERAQGSSGSDASLGSRTAPRARDALFLAGLMNAAVNVRANPYEGD